MKKSVKRNFMLPQTCDEVWQALTNCESLAEWMYPNDFEARVGHRFTFQVPPNQKVNYEGLVVHCEVLRSNPPKELVLSWVAGGISTLIVYHLEKRVDGTKVYFEQSGFEENNDHAYKGAENGWVHMHVKFINFLASEPA